MAFLNFWTIDLIKAVNTWVRSAFGNVFIRIFKFKLTTRWAVIVGQKEGWKRNLKQQTEQSEVVSNIHGLRIRAAPRSHSTCTSTSEINQSWFHHIHYCSSELQQWDKESKDTFIVVTRCKNEGTYFVPLYKDLFVVLHKVWDRKVVIIRRESLFLPTCYNGKLQQWLQWLLTHHSFIGFTQFPLRRLTVKKGKFHPVKSFFCLFNFCRESVYCVPLQFGELEENYGHFSLSSMNGDISVLGQNCATDASNHISLYLHASRNFTASPNTL